MLPQGCQGALNQPRKFRIKQGSGFIMKPRSQVERPVRSSVLNVRNALPVKVQNFIFFLLTILYKTERGYCVHRTSGFSHWLKVK